MSRYPVPSRAHCSPVKEQRQSIHIKTGVPQSHKTQRAGCGFGRAQPRRTGTRRSQYSNTWSLSVGLPSNFHPITPTGPHQSAWTAIQPGDMESINRAGGSSIFAPDGARTHIGILRQSSEPLSVPMEASDVTAPRRSTLPSHLSKTNNDAS